MNMAQATPPGVSAFVDPQVILRHRGWFLAFGIIMVLLGMAAISWSFMTEVTIAATWVFGVLLLGAGLAELVSVFRAGPDQHRGMHALVGVLYTVTGFMVVDEPGKSALQLTLVIAFLLIIGGLFRIVLAISEPIAGRGWIFFNGLVSLLLGVMIYKQWPASGLWVIGLFLGIELLMNGWVWIGLALGMRQLAKATPR